MYENKNVACLWIDHNKAMIIATSDKNYQGDYDILEKIDALHNTGRSGSENTKNQREIQELNKYFKQVTQHLIEFDVLHVFGPGKAQEQFKNFVEKDEQLRNCELNLGTADTHLTTNQVIAIVRDHFNK